MIHRYSSIFELFAIPTPHLPLNATKPYSQLCVLLTPTATKLAAQECKLQTAISNNLATKLEKLLMMSSHHRYSLIKARSPCSGSWFAPSLQVSHPERLKIVDTSYGRALELVSWNKELAIPLPRPPNVSHDLIVDRPLKFKHLRLRRGLNLKRRHQDFLIKFVEFPDVCPYNTSFENFVKDSIEAEKRACAVGREVLGMTAEKQTLLDHLTHFRKDFGFSNQLRGMIIRHPELFYVSVKGLRDSVFLTECFDDKGKLSKKDETSVIKDRLIEIVWESKRIGKKRRNRDASSVNENNRDSIVGRDEFGDVNDDYDDGFDSLFEFDDLGSDYDLTDDFHLSNEQVVPQALAEFWTADTSFAGMNEEARSVEPW